MIRRLGQVKEVASQFYLGGGTALALQLGHRKSDDLDLFSRPPFDVEQLAQLVVSLGGRILNEQRGTVHAIIDGIKVSFLHYPYELMAPSIQIESLKMAAIEDIACMKIIAVSQRGEKKDFYDLIEIMRHFKPTQLKELLIGKYGRQRINCHHILKSLFYFADAEEAPDPISLNNTTWEGVKQYLLANEQALFQGLCNCTADGRST